MWHYFFIFLHVTINCDAILWSCHMLQLNVTLFFDLVTCFKFLKVLKFQSHASQPVIYAAIKSWLKQNFPKYVSYSVGRTGWGKQQLWICKCLESFFFLHVSLNLPFYSDLPRFRTKLKLFFFCLTQDHPVSHTALWADCAVRWLSVLNYSVFATEE